MKALEAGACDWLPRLVLGKSILMQCVDDGSGDSLDAVLWEQVPGREGTLKVSPAAERILGYPLTAWEEPEFLQSIAHPDDLAFVPIENRA